MVPLPAPENMSIQSNTSRNTYSPSFQLEVDHLLQEFPEADREEEATQVRLLWYWAGCAMYQYEQLYLHTPRWVENCVYAGEYICICVLCQKLWKIVKGEGILFKNLLEVFTMNGKAA